MTTDIKKLKEDEVKGILEVIERFFKSAYAGEYHEVNNEIMYNSIAQAFEDRSEVSSYVQDIVYMTTSQNLFISKIYYHWKNIEGYNKKIEEAS